MFSFNSAKLGGGLCEGASARFSKKSIECRLLFETGWFVVVGCGSSSGAPFSLSLSVLVTRQPQVGVGGSTDDVPMRCTLNFSSDILGSFKSLSRVKQG